jgi:hypothetical protein
MSDLARQVSETGLLLRHRKSEVAQQISIGIEVATAELLAISKLEVRLANLEAFLRLAGLTRESEPGSDAAVGGASVAGS